MLFGLEVFRSFFLSLPDTIENELIPAHLEKPGSVSDENSSQSPPANFPALPKLVRADTELILKDAQSKKKFGFNELSLCAEVVSERFIFATACACGCSCRSTTYFESYGRDGGPV